MYRYRKHSRADCLEGWVFWMETDKRLARPTPGVGLNERSITVLRLMYSPSHIPLLFYDMIRRRPVR
jgi:hypothetical protein